MDRVGAEVGRGGDPVAAIRSGKGRVAERLVEDDILLVACYDNVVAAAPLDDVGTLKQVLVVRRPRGIRRAEIRVPLCCPNRRLLALRIDASRGVENRCGTSKEDVGIRGCGGGFESCTVRSRTQVVGTVAARERLGRRSPGQEVVPCIAGARSAARCGSGEEEGIGSREVGAIRRLRNRALQPDKLDREVAASACRICGHVLGGKGQLAGGVARLRPGPAIRARHDAVLRARREVRCGGRRTKERVVRTADVHDDGDLVEPDPEVVDHIRAQELPGIDPSNLQRRVAERLVEHHIPLVARHHDVGSAAALHDVCGAECRRMVSHPR